MAITKPIEDEDLWGIPTGHEFADYWDFGHLLVKFEKLAELNLIDWPLRNLSQWRDIEKVKVAMAETFEQLPQIDKESVVGDYEVFLRLDNSFDWVAMAEYEEPKNVVSGERWIKAMAAMDEYKAVQRELAAKKKRKIKTTVLKGTRK